MYRYRKSVEVFKFNILLFVYRLLFLASVLGANHSAKAQIQQKAALGVGTPWAAFLLAAGLPVEAKRVPGSRIYKKKSSWDVRPVSLYQYRRRCRLPSSVFGLL